MLYSTVRIGDVKPPFFQPLFNGLFIMHDRQRTHENFRKGLDKPGSQHYNPNIPTNYMGN